jgi:hypothetical protein
MILGVLNLQGLGTNPQSILTTMKVLGQTALRKLEDNFKSNFLGDEFHHA